MTQDTYTITIGNIQRDLPLFEVAPNLRIAVLNILGDTELTEVSAKELAKKLETIAYDALVTAEAKSVPLIYALSVVTRKPYVVLRKNYKPYMGEAISAETHSITTGKPQTLYLDEKDRALLDSKRVVLVDDVISTGSTLNGMQALMERANAQVVAQAAICTEGDDPAEWENVIALAHLPLFREA